jgi:hypothetical protein
VMYIFLGRTVVAKDWRVLKRKNNKSENAFAKD